MQLSAEASTAAAPQRAGGGTLDHLTHQAPGSAMNAESPGGERGAVVSIRVHCYMYKVSTLNPLPGQLYE